MDSSHVAKTLSILKKLLDKNQHLTCFRDSFSFGIMNSNGRIHVDKSIKFKADNTPEERYPSNRIQSLITFAEYTVRDITNLTTSARSRRSEELPSFYQQVYNDNWKKHLTSKQLGVNVNKKVGIKGYCLNFNDVRKLIHERVESERYESIFDFVNQFYYFGKRNILIAIMTVGGDLLIREQAFKKIIDQNDEATSIDCLECLLICYQKQLEKFEDYNLSEYKRELLDIVQSSVLTKIVNGDMFGYRYRRYSTNTQEANSIDMSKIIDSIKHIVNDKISTLMAGNLFGATDNYSYHSLLVQSISRRKDMESRLYEEAFKKGMQIGLKLEMLGWKPCKPKLADDTSVTNMWWEKDVDIRPESFMFQNERYILPKEHRHHYHIKKLYVNQEGTLRCDGKHPNVSGSKVCMGDLEINFIEDLSKMQDNFERIETLLDMINYDSAYHYDKRDEFLKVAIKDENFVGKKVKKKSDIQIRELGSSSWDDTNEDGEEEIIVNQQPTKITNNVVVDNQIIGYTIENSTPSPDLVAASQYRNRSDVSSYDETERIPVEQAAASENYYQVEARVSQNVSLVDEAGNVHNVTQPVNIRVDAAQITRTAVHVFSLGDANIVRRPNTPVGAPAND